MTLLPELLGAGQRLGQNTSASTSFAVGLAGAAPLIYASGAMRTATNETAIARPMALGNFMEAPLLPARATAARCNSFNSCRGSRACPAAQWTGIGHSRRN